MDTRRGGADSVSGAVGGAHIHGEVYLENTELYVPVDDRRWSGWRAPFEIITPERDGREESS